MSDGIQALIDKKVNEERRSTLVSSIKNLMTNLKFTLEQAMDALSIPQADRATYAGLVQKEL